MYFEAAVHDLSLRLLNFPPLVLMVMQFSVPVLSLGFPGAQMGEAIVVLLEVHQMNEFSTLKSLPEVKNSPVKRGPASA